MKRTTKNIICYFEDDEGIVDKLMGKIETMMQPDETVWYFGYV